MKNKVLTVAIAAYQVESYLAKTLDSLLLPDVLEALEVLVIDDGSTDGTAALAKQYEEKYPDTVRLVSKENGGHGAAVERGIKEASGEYFKNIDGDDWVDEEGFRELMRYLIQNEDRIDMISTPYEMVDHHTGKRMKQITEQIDGVQYGKIYSFTNICDDIYVNMHAVTYRTKFIQEHMPPLDHHCFYVDAEYVLLPVPFVQTIVFLEKPVYQYRLGLDGQSMNLRNMQKHCSDHEKVLNRILEAYGAQREIAATVWKRGSKEDIDRQAALCRYMAKGAAKLAASQIKVYLSFPASSQQKDRICMLEQQLLQEYPEVYEANQNKAVSLLRKSRYRLYRIASWAVQRKLT